jgi:hypothetical protein
MEFDNFDDEVKQKYLEQNSLRNRHNFKAQIKLKVS